MLEDLRRTGRTSRMIQEIVRQSINGTKKFGVMGLHHAHVTGLMQGVEDHLIRLKNIKFIVNRSQNKIFITSRFGAESVLIFITSEDTEKLTGIHVDELFQDHYMLEEHFAVILKELHRWDY